MGFEGVPVFLQLSGSLTDLIANTGDLAKTILAVLLILSVVSWTIMFEKIRYFRRASKQSAAFRPVFEQNDSLGEIIAKAEGLPECPEAALVRKVGKGLATGDFKDLASLDRYMDAAMASIISEWESYVIFLSTTATVSPFLGLLGTVWGIMSSFLSMGVRGSANLYVIGPGIADALITTIFGLGAAIPAVVGYNYVLRILRRREDDLSSFSVRFRARIIEGRYQELKK
jgi:biopolymer transport protein TolQ